jgi:excisionase family DNA binding protein
VNPWRATGASVSGPPEAWLWIAAWTSRAGRSAGLPRALRDFIAAAEAAARADPTRALPSTEVTAEASSTLVEVDVRTVAARLGCTPRWVTTLCSTGRITARKVGRTWLIDAASVDRETPREPAS